MFCNLFEKPGKGFFSQSVHCHGVCDLACDATRRPVSALEGDFYCCLRLRHQNQRVRATPRGWGPGGSLCCPVGVGLGDKRLPQAQEGETGQGEGDADDDGEGGQGVGHQSEVEGGGEGGGVDPRCPCGVGDHHLLTGLV
jgi:hypothetical protein